MREHKALLCYWDFAEPAGELRVSKGPLHYGLREMNGPVERVTLGIQGAYAAKLKPGQWFSLPRAECPELNFCGDRSAFTVIAWVNREERQSPECQVISGMWNESQKKRQYALFLDLRIWESREHYNPYAYGKEIFDGGSDGADFTVGAVDRSGEPGNFYSGLLGGLAVFNRALTEEEILSLRVCPAGGDL